MERTLWNQHVQELAPAFGAFLQSYEWGEFQVSVGKTVERVYKKTTEGRVLAQIITTPLFFGQTYHFIPKGPLGTGSLDHRIGVIREEIEEGVFLRIEPEEEGRLAKVKDIQPATTLRIDLEKEEETLWQEMKSKTRYNVRLGQKKGVDVRFVDVEEYFGDFIRIMEQTAVRDHFHAHTPSYYKKMFEMVQSEDIQVRLAMAFYEGRPLAGNIIVDFGDTRTYLHGATSNLHRNVMAQYVLHGFLIFDAKKEGKKWFDFWGIAPEGADEKHDWYGITRYKKGYGGEVVEMPGTYDLPVKHGVYVLYQWLRKVNRWIRR